MNFMNIEHRTSNIQHRMWRTRTLRPVLGVFAAGMVLSASFGAQQTNNYPTVESFKIIRDRNIFDPNRRPGYVVTTNHPPHRVVDAFALVGTMSYSKGRFAFFNGQSSQYKQVLEPGGNIAGYTVKEVAQDAVTLTANGKDFQMAVGAQMRKVDNKWQLSGHIIEEADVADETNGEAAAVESSALPAGVSGDAAAILKRLMDQRKQESQ